MKTPTEVRAALAEFENQHGHVVTTALRVYAECMRKDAAEIQAGYDKIKDDPEARARQDASMFTMSGLLWTAQAVREAADQADKAREAWESLAEDGEADDPVSDPARAALLIKHGMRPGQVQAALDADARREGTENDTRDQWQPGTSPA
jgi:hypothetical protein